MALVYARTILNNFPVVFSSEHPGPWETDPRSNLKSCQSPESIMEAANASEGKWFTVWSQFVVALWKNLTLSVCKFFDLRIIGNYPISLCN